MGPPKMKQCRPRRYFATKNRLADSKTNATAFAIAAPAILFFVAKYRLGLHCFIFGGPKET